MSADKRTVSTDALATLGTIITEGGRDAIHLAVEPVVAGERLYPSAHIGVKNGKAYHNTDKLYAHCDKFLGIVDPFLLSPVEIGDRFWLIVYPRQITSLRHVWEHPDFDKKLKDIESEFHTSQKWIEDFAESHGLTYERVISVADENANGGYETISLGQSETQVPAEFWDHYQVVRGKVVEEANKGSFFSCAC